MGRVRISLPDDLDFTVELRVRVTDLNFANHLGNDALVSLLHEARSRFVEHHGWTERNIEGRSIVIGDLAAVYTAEACGGDVLRIEVGVADFRRAGCDILYRVVRTSDGVQIARAKTGIVFIDRTARKPVPVPPPFRARFNGA